MDLSDAWDTASCVEIFYKWLPDEFEHYRKGLLYRLINTKYLESVYSLNPEIDYSIDDKGNSGRIFCSSEEDIPNFQDRDGSCFSLFEFENEDQEQAVVVYNPDLMKIISPTGLYEFVSSNQDDRCKAVIAMIRLKLSKPILI